MTNTIPFTKKALASSILLWMRTDQPRQQGMEHWKGPHSKIISASPGLDEYRQLHLDATIPGLWPATHGVETTIPADRKIDGVAEVTFASALAPVQGRAQTKLAFQDEVNVFRRTLMYAGPPNSTRWYERNGDTGSRALVYVRRREGVGTRAFRRYLTDSLVPALTKAAPVTELRTQVFMPWNEKLWNTPTSPTTIPPTSGSTPPWCSASPMPPRARHSSRATRSRPCQTSCRCSHRRRTPTTSPRR